MGHDPAAEITPPEQFGPYSGYVIAFAEDANRRAFSEAAMLLFMNAALLGPAY